MGHSHSIYIFNQTESDPDHWHTEIYKKIRKNISAGDAVIYVAEEDENKTMQNLVGIGVPIEDHIKEGLLTIINRDVFYSPFIPTHILLEQWNKLFTNIKKKAGDKIRGFVAIGMPAESFFVSNADKQQLVMYESLAANKYDGTIEAMCLYDTGLIQKLQLGQIITLLNAHQNTGHDDGLKEWNSKRALSIIKRGLDASLGNNVSEMVLSIIVRDFGRNEEALIIHPDQFEKKLLMLLGQTAADVVIDSIKKEITRDIAY